MTVLAQVRRVEDREAAQGHMGAAHARPHRVYTVAAGQEPPLIAHPAGSLSCWFPHGSSRGLGQWVKIRQLLIRPMLHAVLRPARGLHASCGTPPDVCRHRRLQGDPVQHAATWVGGSSCSKQCCMLCCGVAAQGDAMSTAARGSEPAHTRSFAFPSSQVNKAAAYLMP